MAALTLVIMAAGMGSRYGGLKQIDPVDGDGHIIMDFSAYDAMAAGFDRIVFVIKKENEDDFRRVIGDRLAEKIEVRYAYQDIRDLPAGFSVPEGRVKPWGTGQALLCCADLVDGPCAVINADDYYGPAAFRLVADYLRSHRDDDKYRYVMAGFRLDRTLTDNGSVSRGVCTVDEAGCLTDVTERTRIEKRPDGPAFSEDGGRTRQSLPGEMPVSMNMWGFGASIFPELRARFAAFLTETLSVNPLKGEYFLPFVVNELLKEGKASVRVLRTPDQWYGVTYREDKAVVTAALTAMEAEGLYRF